MVASNIAQISVRSEIAEQIDGSNNAYHYHADKMGSVRALTTSGSSPSVVNSYTYDAYGTTLTSSETGPANSFWTCPGKVDS